MRASFDLGDFLPYLLNRAGARLALGFSRGLKRHGVVLQEWRVLAVLLAHGTQRLLDLAALTSIDRSTLSRLVERMERGGLVARSRTAIDGRETLVTLTPQGRKTTRAILPMARHYESVALEGLSADEAKALKQLLVRVYANLDGL
jgi:DNA-binding MarR family transcriptional regulator